MAVTDLAPRKGADPSRPSKDSTAYFPYRLIHAHLPSPPPIPYSIPELRVSSSRIFLDPADSPTQDLHSDHASSVIHDTETNILARVLSDGYVLELRTLSLSCSKNGKGKADGAGELRIFFPDPLRSLGERCIRYSEKEGVVYILVVTQANVLYRLNYRTDGRKFSGVDGAEMVFALKGGEDWCEEWEVPGDVVAGCGGVGSWTVVNQNLVVLGGGDGGIVRLIRSDTSSSVWTPHHHRVTSRFRLPRIFSATASSAEQVVSFSFYPGSSVAAPILYSLSRDKKLRAWNTINGTCLRTTDVRPSTSHSKDLALRNSQSSPSSSTSILPDNASVSLLRTIPHPTPTSSYSHVIIVFIAHGPNGASAGCFVVYRVARASGEISYAGDRPCSSRTAGYEMRGFEVLSPVTSLDWRLWVSWDNKGITACDHIAMDDIFQFETYNPPAKTYHLIHDWQRSYDTNDIHTLDPAYFDNLLGLKAPDPAQPEDNSDITNTFILHLLHPGRFSQLSLKTTLEEYIEQLPQQSSTLSMIRGSYPTLGRKFAAIVGCHLEMTTSEETGAPIVETYRRLLKLEWLGIWANVRDLDRHSRWPVSTCLVDNQFMILTREGLTLPVLEDAGELAERLGLYADDEEVFELRQLPEAALQELYPAFVGSRERSDMLAISAAGSSIASVLSADVLEGFTEQLNAELAQGLQQPVENLGGTLWDEYLESNLSEDVHTVIRRRLSDCEELLTGLGTVLDLLGNLPMPSSDTASSGIHHSGTSLALITSKISQIILSRYTLSRNVLLVTLFALSESDSAVHDDESESLLQILARGLVTYHRYRVLKWLSEQTGEEARERVSVRGKGKRRSGGGGDDSLANGLGGLKVRDRQSDVEGFDSDGYDLSYSLLHSLLARRCTPPYSSESTSPTLSAALSFLESAGMVSKDENDWAELGARSGDLKMIEFVLLDGHGGLAGKMTELYEYGSGVAYWRGRSWLDLGNWEGAGDHFQRAAAGFQGGSLGSIIQSDSQGPPLMLYYRHITGLFEVAGHGRPVAYFGQLAIDATRPDDPEVKDLWTKVFLANVSLQEFEEAYTILAALSHLDLKREFLAQLISAMCESNEVGRLNLLSFVGLQQDVEDILGFKARNSDPLRFPNYYKVLYSWHISRGDYRSAGEIMYLQGRRFGNTMGQKVPAFDLATMQARSYLAAINALSLVDERNAWVSVPGRPSTIIRTNKRKRTTSCIPEEEFTKGKQAVDLVTLDDIRVEYTLVLSKLELYGQVPDLIEHNTASTPVEIVNLFVQHGMYDLAQSSARSLDVDMTPLFRSLAERCLQLHRNPTSTDPSSSAWLRKSPITSRLRGPPSTLALRYLQISLERHDSIKTNWMYGEQVSEAWFQQCDDKREGWVMPRWLVQREIKRDVEGWVSRGIKWGWVEECVDWLNDWLREVTPPELLQRGRAGVVYTPWNLIERVVAATQEGDEKDDAGVQRKAEMLREAVKRRKDGMLKL